MLFLEGSWFHVRHKGVSNSFWKKNSFFFQKVDAEKVRYTMQLAVVQKRAEKSEAKVVSIFTFSFSIQE